MAIRSAPAPGETESHHVQQALERYRVTLAAAGDGAAGTDVLLEALLRRDQVAAVMAEPLHVALDDVRQLAELDAVLTGAAARVREDQWPAWRRTLSPGPERWWWYLDQDLAGADRRVRLPVWIATAGLMAVTLHLTVQIVQRLLAGGPDLLTATAAALGVALTTGPLLPQGRDLADAMVERLGVRVRSRAWAAFAAAVLALSTVLLVWGLVLPGVALALNNQGYRLLEAGELNRARGALLRAASLDPEYGAAYYNLAHAYAQIGDYTEARPLYTRALAVDPTVDPAFNEIGYLLILDQKPQAAIPVLHAGLTRALDDQTRVALWTNLGRAYLATGRYVEGREALHQALAIDPHEAAAHCTLGQVASALDATESELRQWWEGCLRYADVTTARGQELALMARAHLEQMEGGP